MRVAIPFDEARADAQVGGHTKDASGVGINYADVIVKAIKLTLEDGRKLTCKRRGLKLTLTIGDRAGEGLLRRLANGPDERRIVREGLAEAARNAGVALSFEPGAVVIDTGGAPIPTS
jgi:hypothetical protein